MELKGLHLPVRLRPVDLIVLVLLVALCLSQMIQGTEITQLRRELRELETEARP